MCEQNTRACARLGGHATRCVFSFMFLFFQFETTRTTSFPWLFSAEAEKSPGNEVDHSLSNLRPLTP